MIILENERLAIKAKRYGAELTSIILKDDYTEYLWQGDPKYWARHAPILFPIVGKLVDNQYVIDNKTYKLNQHGFARDMVFDVYSQNKREVTFELKSNKCTLEKYPYPFELRVIYEVIDNSVLVRYTVKNSGSGRMYFSIGAHPAFNWPLDNSKTEDYFLEFEKDETVHSRLLRDGVISNISSPILDNQSIIPLTKQLFYDDALILQGLKSNKITLRSKSSNKSITVDYSGFPFLGIWSKPEGAPFICIEPWHGLADTQDSKGILCEKEGIRSLDPEEIFDCEFKIIIG